MLQRRLKGIKQLASTPKPQEEARTQNGQVVRTQDGQADNTLRELGSADSEQLIKTTEIQYMIQRNETEK